MNRTARWGVIGVALSLVTLVGCHSAFDLGGGRYVVTQSTEQRSPFGTNMGFARAVMCDAPAIPEDGIMPIFPDAKDYRNCQAVTDWMPLGSQGQGGQIVGGALMGIGIGVAGSIAEGASASATGGSASSSSIAVSGAAKGHH